MALPITVEEQDEQISEEISQALEGLALAPADKAASEQIWGILKVEAQIIATQYCSCQLGV